MRWELQRKRNITRLSKSTTRAHHNAKEGQGNVVSVVRLPGFEPGLEAWKASILDQSRPQPQK